MQKITPFLWFDGDAEAAVALYTSLFENSRVLGVQRYPEGAPGPAGKVMTIEFQLEGQDFVALNGGPQYRFTPALSFFVRCGSQAEVDRLWDGLLAGGGQPDQCGWLRDRFGVSWQIVPSRLLELMQDPDPAKAGRVVQAMLQMVKIDVAALERAYQSEEPHHAPEDA